MEQEERIEQYIKGTLSPTETAIFEKELDENIELQKIVEEHLTVMLGVKSYFQDQTLAHFQTLEQQAIQQNRKKITFLQWGSLVAAASILVLLWLNNPFQSISSNELYATYYTTYPNYVQNIERSDPKEQISYQNAFFAYEQQDYQQAIQTFKALNLPKDPVIEFYWGLSYLELKQYKAAILHLERAAKNPNHRYYNHSIWYQGLALIQTKDYEKATVVFKQLTVKDNPYQEKAATLLNEIKKLRS